MIHIRFQVEKKFNIFEIPLPFLSFFELWFHEKMVGDGSTKKDREQSKISYENQYHR